MKKALRKYGSFRKTICALLMLYMVHAFSITALVAAPHTSPLVNTSITSNTASNATNTPQKNNNRPYSFFIAKHSIIKSIRLTEAKNLPASTSELVCLAALPKTVSYNSNPFILSLGDNAFKRYLSMQVFLI